MQELTQSRLKEQLSYDPETGVFTWLVGVLVKGKIAGSKHKQGYWRILINGKKYLAHRLAWLYVYGQWPEVDIDHIDGITNNNRIANLRKCTEAQNKWNAVIPRNNTSGFKGAYWRNDIGKWRARITIRGKGIDLGYFPTAALASEAYNTKAKELHGEFYRNTVKEERKIA